MKLQNFEILEKLGEGAYSSVYKVKRTIDQQIYALKKVSLKNLSLKEKENALNEVRIIASIRHPNVVSFKESFVSDDGEYLYLVMDYADDGDVLEKIKKHLKSGTRLREDYIWNVFIQSIKGLQILHNLNVYHRDIKSANLFLYKDGTTKIGDFNVSKQAKQGLLYTQTGTPYYASPEVWSDQPYTSSSDIWSIGCVLYELTTLSPPFNGDSMKELFHKVMSGVYKRISPKYSTDLSHMIQYLLQVDSKKRLSCSQILQIPFVQKRINEKRILGAQEEEKSILLKTIQFKQATTSLQENLPQPNYQNPKLRKKTVNEFIDNLDDSNNENSFCLQPSITIKSPRDRDSSHSNQHNDKRIKYSKESSKVPSLREIKQKKTQQQNHKNERSNEDSSRSKNSIQIDLLPDIEGKHIDLILGKKDQINLSIQMKKQQNISSDLGLQREQLSKELQIIKGGYIQRGRSPGILKYKNIKISEEVNKEQQGQEIKEKKYSHAKGNDSKSQNIDLNDSISLKRGNTRASNHSQDQISQNGRNIFLPILYQNKYFLSSSNSPPLSRMRQDTYTRKILQEIYTNKIEDQNKVRSLDRKRKNNQQENNNSMKLMPSLNRSLNQSGDFSNDRLSKNKNTKILPSHQRELQRQIGLTSIEEKKEDNQINIKKSVEKQKTSIESELQNYPQQNQIKSYKRFNNLRQSNEQPKFSQNSQSPQKPKNELHLPSISKSSVLQNQESSEQLQSQKSVNKFRIPTNILKKIDQEEQSSQQLLTKKSKQLSSLQTNNEQSPRSPPNIQ